MTRQFEGEYDLIFTDDHEGYRLQIDVGDPISIPLWKWERMLDILMVFGERHNINMDMSSEYIQKYFDGASAEHYYTDYNRKKYIPCIYNYPSTAQFAVTTEDAHEFFEKMRAIQDENELKRLWISQHPVWMVVDYHIGCINQFFDDGKDGTDMDKLELFINETMQIKDKSTMRKHVREEFADVWDEIQKIEHLKRIRNAMWEGEE